MRPRLLDLFSGAGGAAVGYDRAGFDVVGVDINPQKNYPFEFHQADAMSFPLDGFDAIHASPPCQCYSVSTVGYRAAGKQYDDLLAPTRDRLIRNGLPWVIENVPGAPMRVDVQLCGSMFGLPRLRRHRWFEMSSGTPPQLLHPCWHQPRTVSVVGNGTASGNRWWWDQRPKGGSWVELCRAAMGIDWMNRTELSQAIPPVYTEWIGAHLMEIVTKESDRAPVRAAATTTHDT